MTGPNKSDLLQVNEDLIRYNRMLREQLNAARASRDEGWLSAQAYYGKYWATLSELHTSTLRQSMKIANLEDEIAHQGKNIRDLEGIVRKLFDVYMGQSDGIEDYNDYLDILRVARPDVFVDSYGDYDGPDLEGTVPPARQEPLPF